MSRICGSFVLLLFGNGRSVLGCAKGDVAMLTVLKVINLTGACSSLAVVVSCFAGVDVVGGSKSNSISSIGQGSVDMISNITQLF